MCGRPAVVSDFVDCIFEMYALNSETSSSNATVCRTGGTVVAQPEMEKRRSPLV